MSAFPIGSSVLLQNLVKGAHLNGKKGIVKSRPNASTGRQEVYVFEAQKSMAVKPSNLRYEPRELSSLSISEMKGVLTMRSESAGEGSTEWSGMDKEVLRGMVEAEIGTEDPAEIAALVAKANEPKEPAANGNAPVTNNAGMASAQLRQGAERMASMTPDDLRRQAATMRAMGPAGLRACTPQMAGMSDEQINMAISQMEAMANNPGQMKMAADQMKNMSDSDLRRAVDQSPLSSQTAPTPAAASSGSATTASPAAAPTINNISRSQFQQATQQMSSMSPEQMRQQAAMLRSMPLETLRQTNPQMANMSDAQIQMSIAQLEQMAENPAMLRMAADQMKNMTEEQYESVKKMMGGAGGGGTAATPGGAAGLPSDPSKVMESLLSNPEQLNSAVKMMKQNPDMLKQALASQMGIGGDDSGGDGGSDARREQLEKAIDSFANMDEEKLEKYLKLANRVQSVAKPVVGAFERAKTTLGVSTRTLVILLNLGVFAGFIMLARWWQTRVDAAVENDISTLGQEEPLPDIVDYNNEF